MPETPRTGSMRAMPSPIGKVDHVNALASTTPQSDTGRVHGLPHRSPATPASRAKNAAAAPTLVALEEPGAHASGATATAQAYAPARLAWAAALKAIRLAGAADGRPARSVTDQPLRRDLRLRSALLVVASDWEA